MKKANLLLTGGLIMLFSNLAIAGDVFEIVSFKYKNDIIFEDQKKAMKSLNNVVKKFKGFKSRDYYYSSENQRWFDFVVWDSLEDAKKASKAAMKDPEAGKVFSLMDEKTAIFSHYEHLGGVKKIEVKKERYI